MYPHHAGPTPVPSAQSSASLAPSSHGPESSPRSSQTLQHPTERSSSLHPYTSSPSPQPGRTAPPQHPSSMGQGPSSVTHSPGPDASGNKLKRALAGRRKNSADATSIFSAVQHLVMKGRERTQSSATPPPAALTSNTMSSPAPNRNQAAHSAKQIGMHLATSTKHAFGSKKNDGPRSPRSPTAGPRPLPPIKPTELQAPKLASSAPLITPVSSVQPNASAAVSTASFASASSHFAPSVSASAPPAKLAPISTAVDRRGSVMPHSPSMEPALHFLRKTDALQVTPEVAGAEEEEAKPEEKRDVQADWRKSDATMTGHHPTARPGAMNARSSRPVSMAESVNSTSTVMPVNRRLSALVTESEYATVEEEFSRPDESQSSLGHSQPMKNSPTPSIKALNRRSQSLSLGPTWATRYRSAAEVWEHPAALTPGTHREQPALSTTAATGFIAPSHTGDASSPMGMGGGLRGRLAAWTSAAAASSGGTPRKKADALSPPPPHSARDNVTSSPRQASSTVASALGATGVFAVAFGKKVGRAWGARAGSPSSLASSTSTPPSSYNSGDELGRVHSNGSSGLLSVAGKGKGRRTPNAPSGSWSMTSSTTSSTSDSDQYSEAGTGGPFLGRPLRRAIQAGGLVFNHDLADCVRLTRAVDQQVADAEVDLDFEVLGAEVFAKRQLPALVRRCAEHIIQWGVGGDEEGLFRISGRSTHVNKLRKEFDAGADYDLVACTPADLDPHAVASVFKAYLRELPEAILTQELAGAFEAAMATENEANNSAVSASVDSPGPMSQRGRGGGLPTGPRAGGVMPLRKPPSLSTLAAPSFAGLKAASRTLMDTLASLIRQLPQENRDLLRTVTDLIKETAKKSRVTKMPLSNLLLVFCPSLHMSPGLVRVLCEAHGVWKELGNKPMSPVIEIKQDELSRIIEISPPPSARNAEHPPDARPQVLQLPSASPAGAEAYPKSPASGQISREATVLSDDESGISGSIISNSSRSTFPDTLSQGIAPSTSSDSLSMGPTTPSEAPSPLGSPIKMQVAPSPVAMPSTGLHINVPGKEISASGPVTFPVTGSPVIPISPKKTFPSLSLPTPTTPSEASPSSPKASPRALRMKRPSLTLLFSGGKRSPSPLSGGKASISSPQLVDSSRTDSPEVMSALSARSAVATPQSERSAFLSRPPMLDTNVSMSPMAVTFSPASAVDTPETARPNLASYGPHLTVNPRWAAGPPGVSATTDMTRAESTATTASYASAQSNPGENLPFLRERPTRQQRSPTTSSYDPLCVDFGGEDMAPEEWTKSVLLAADMGPDFTSLSSVADAIKAYERRS